MKISRCLILLFCILCVASCHHRPVYPPVLHEVDSLTYVAPQQALQVLDSIVVEMVEADKPTRMYHQLLTVKAKDKAYISQTSDSVMLTLVDYYEHGGDKSLLPEAYYYLGSAYRDLNDAPQALEYYQKALEVMPEDASPLRRYVNNQMGSLYYRQYLYDQALACYQNSYENDSLLQDRMEMSSDLVNIGYIYSCFDDYEASLLCYAKAKSLLEESDVSAMAEINTQIAGLYMNQGDVEKAKSYILLPLKHTQPSTISSIYSIASKIYLNAGQKDSAFYYLNKLLEVGNIYGRRMAYEQLSIMALNDNRREEAAHYIQQFRILADSIQQITASETIAQMSYLYGYQLHEREKAEAQSRANKLQLYLNTGIAVFAIVTLMLFSYGQYYKRKELKTKVRMEKLIALRQQEHQRSLSYIHENEEKITVLTKRINELEGSETQLKVELENAKEQLVMENKMAEVRMEQREQAVHAIQASSWRESLVKKAEASKHINEEDVLSMEELLNAIYPHFIEELKSLGRFNETEYRVSLLLKMKIAPKHICELVNRDKSTVSNIKRRLFVRFTGKPGSAKDWDDFVDSI